MRKGIETIRVESARAADIPALSDLLSVLFTQEAEFAPNPQAQHRGLAGIIANPDVGVVLVAWQGDHIVGMVNLLFTLSTALGEKVALLEDLVVSPAARGSGVGTQLLIQAIAAARMRGCKRITLLTDGSNAAAQRLYAKHGFAMSDMVPMRLALE